MFKSERLALFRIQPYRWFILQCFFVNIGSGLLYINLTWIAVKIYNNANSVALLMLSFWLPVVLLGPLAGVIVDRFPRKLIMNLCNGLRALLLIIFFIMTSQNAHLTLWLICVLNICSGIASAFVMPAIMTFVREVVCKKKLLYANATTDIAYEVGNVVGMGAAGFIIAYTSLSIAILINACCFVCSLVFMLIAKTPKTDSKDLTEKHWLSGLVRDYVLGLRYLGDNSKLCFLYLVQLFVFAVFLTSPVLLAPFAKSLLHANIGQFGGLEASISIGAVIGGVVAPWLAERWGNNKTCMILLFIMLAGYLLFCRNRQLFDADLLNVFIGFSFASWPLLITMAQSQTQFSYQGRVQSTFNSLSGLFIIFIYLMVSFYGNVWPIADLYMVQVVISVIAIAFFVAYMLKPARDGSHKEQKDS